MKKIKFLVFFFAFAFLSTMAISQKVNNVKAELDGDNVKITFDLDDPNASNLFEIKLFASHNNFSEPLKLVTGALGKSIKPGKNLVITWNAKEELKNFKGEITFEVRATVMGSYYIVSNPASSSKFKKGKMMPINWQGGEPGEKVKIELVRLKVPVSTISENVGNQGSYVWTIPKSTKAGKGFQVKITNTSDINSNGISKGFAIKGKSAAPYILIPLVLAGGAGAYVVTQGGGGTTPNNNNETKALPTPPYPTQ